MPNLKAPEVNSRTLDIIKAKRADAVQYRDELHVWNTALEDRYNAEYYGTEVAGRSKYVSNDVKDAVEDAHTSLVRIFLGANPIVKFLPSNPENQKQVEEADAKTKYVDWIVRKQPNAYKTQSGFLLEVLKFKAAYLKYYYEETETVEEHEWEGLSAIEVTDQLDAIVADKSNKELELISSNIEEIETDDGLSKRFKGNEAFLAEQEENEDGTFDIKVKVKVKRQCIKVIGVPTGSFLISKGATDKDDAELVGDSSYKSRGQLVAEGHSVEFVSKLASASITGSSYRSIDIDNLKNPQTADFGEWASQLVPIDDLYVKVDTDDDGIAERRNIQMSGDDIIYDEPFNHVPYAIASALIKPHQAIGEGWAEQVTDIAEVNTAITRGILDNVYSVNNTKKVIRANKNDGLNINEAVSSSIGGIIRAKGDKPLADLYMPIVTPFIGNEALLIKQHMDQMKANRVGNQLTSQGLDGDTLSKETATRFTGIEKSDQAKIEKIARNVVETAYKDLYEGVAWTAQHNQIDELELNILGKQLVMDPSKWKYPATADTEIGLGASDNEKIVENMTGLWNMSTQLKAEGSKLTDDSKRYNIGVKLMRAIDLKDPSQFMNNPEEPEEVLQADNEQLNAMVIQLQEQLQQLQNPLAEAETIKAQAKLIEAQGKGELSAAKMMQDQQEFMLKLKQDNDQFRATMAKQLTELGLKYDEDIEGAID